jgi:hypothetical protein
MKVFLTFFLVYWSFGMFILPNGDFSALSDIPAQYQHCKETEDKDLTVFDFITDHLINVDCLFDAHDKGDEQKPHKPFSYSQHSITGTFLITKKIAFLQKTVALPPSKNVFGFPTAANYSFNFLTSIFHPPVV